MSLTNTFKTDMNHQQGMTVQVYPVIRKLCVSIIKSQQSVKLCQKQHSRTSSGDVKKIISNSTFASQLELWVSVHL